MKKIGRYWVDENNNKWNSSLYTEACAEECSKTLVNCKDCKDCKDCRNCVDCFDCRSCVHCTGCMGCKYCEDCIDCRDCNSCKNCRGCVGCKDCKDCKDCRNCVDCFDCRSCISCGGCRNCISCISCIDCIDFKRNPRRLVSGYIGSRESQTVIYWDCDMNLVKCGCFVENLLTFEKKVKEKHKDNIQYLDEYMKFIDVAWISIENI